MSIKDIPVNTTAGQLLMAALAILTSSPNVKIDGTTINGGGTEPDEMLNMVKDVADKMYPDNFKPHTLGANACAHNAKPDEPVFVLRGQDVSAPHIVIEWVNQNLNTCPREKLLDAWDVAMAMKQYQRVNSKIAD